MMPQSHPEPSTTTEPEQSEPLPTQTVKATNGGSARLAVVSARGRSQLVLAALDPQAIDRVVILVERARAVGRDLTDGKRADALDLLEIGLDELEARDKRQREAFRDMEKMAAAEQDGVPPMRS
jgi:hypothetical protein